MAQPQWPTNGQVSFRLFKMNLRWRRPYYFHCAMHCLNLSASAAVKFSNTKCCKRYTKRQVFKCLRPVLRKQRCLSPCIKEDVFSRGETKRYLVSLCETQFVERHVSIPMKHSKFGAKNFNKVCPKTVQNALKWPLQYVNFQKFSGGVCPRILCSFFLFLNLLQINSAGKNYA